MLFKSVLLHALVAVCLCVVCMFCVSMQCMRVHLSSCQHVARAAASPWLRVVLCCCVLWPVAAAPSQNVRVGLPLQQVCSCGADTTGTRYRCLLWQSRAA